MDDSAMKDSATIDSVGKTSASLKQQARSLLSGYHDRIANAANLSALLFHEMEDVNWAGFYFLRDGELIVGPFQGKPACVRIPLGKGVCGTAAVSREAQLVPDVHAFEGHIACDADSRSEIVVPLIHQGEVLGVLDVDSPTTGRFDDSDLSLLAEIAQIYLDSIE
jgi:GAF domain-containing protein